MANSLDIVRADATKGNAVSALLHQLGLDWSEVMVFGDQDNDVSMLSQTPHSYCMANGSLAASQAAQHMAPHHDADGVAQILEQEILKFV